MSCHHHGPCPEVSPIVCDPIVIVRDHYVPQIVPVIHPIKVVDKIHCCPVEKHIYTYSQEVEDGVYGGAGVRNVAVSAKLSKKRERARSRRKR